MNSTANPIHPRLRDGLLALSMANITLLTVWEDLAATRFFLVGPAATGAVVGAVFDLVGLTACFYVLLRAFERLRAPYSTELRGALLLLSLVIPADWFRRQLGGPAFSAIAETPGRFVLAQLLVGVLLIVPVVRRRAAWAVELGLVCLVPAVAFSLFQAGMALQSYPAIAPLAATAQRPARVRTVVLLFDELDQRTAFIDRPEGLKLPAFDALAERSVVMENAYSSYGGTINALPSLIAGESFEGVSIDGHELMVKPVHEKAVTWAERPGILGWAHQRNLRTSVVGWYLPYCGVFSKLLTFCSSGSTRPESRADLPVADAMAIHLRRVVENAPMMDRLGVAARFYLDRNRRTDRALHIEAIQRVWRDGLAEIGNPDRDLVFVHWPVPHGPHVYDPATGGFRTDRDSTYLDSLQLVDRILADVARRLESSGLRDRTSLLVIADHWWRRAPRIDHRVPFIVNLPGSSTGTQFRRFVRSLAMSEVVKALLADELKSSEDVVTLLTRLSTGDDSADGPHR
jgi:hypothetical protein